MGIYLPVAVASLAGLLACAKAEGESHANDQGPLELTLVGASIDQLGILGGPRRGTAVFEVRNRTNAPVTFRGFGQPDYKLAVRGEREWIEEGPDRLWSCFEEEIGRIDPSEFIQLDAYIPSVDHKFRIAVGCWIGDVDDTSVPRAEWTWTWSDPFVVSETVQEAASGDAASKRR